MEVKMQTSFIPKKPIVESRPAGSGVSLFLLLSIIIFIVTVAAAFGVWLWQASLVTQIEKDKQDLLTAKSKYEEGSINDLIRLDNRINISKNLLNSHLAVSPVFALLENNVLKFVRLKSMKFSYAGKDKVTINLSGIASSYDVLSKQSDAFGNAKLDSVISRPVISDFNPLAEGGISFNFSASIFSKLITVAEINQDTLAPIMDNLNNATTTNQ
jgi:hypothetical protein